MSISRFIFAVSLCVAASVAALGQGNQGGGLLSQTFGPTSADGTLVIYSGAANPLLPQSLTGPSNPIGVLVTPDGSKVYLVGSSGVSPLVSYSLALSDPPGLSNPHSIGLSDPGGLSVTPSAAVVTPDGQHLLVGGTDAKGASYLFVVNTVDDSVLAGSGIPLQLPGSPGPAALEAPGCATCWITVSHDSQVAYVLTNSPSGNQITAYSLASYQQLGVTAASSGYATGITLSPQSVLYVSGGNQILVFDPTSLVKTNTIQVTFNFGPLQFTPDGSAAYSINQAPTQPAMASASLAQLNIATGVVTTWPPQNTGQTGPQLNQVLVAGNSQVFAYSSNLTTLYDITTSSLSGVPSLVLTAALSSAAAQNVLAVAISNEVPAHYLFVVIANGSQPYLSRVDLTSNTESVRQGSPGLSTSLMQFAGVPVQTGAATIVQYNNPQIVNPGKTSLPLIGRVFNSAGQPVYKLPVTFSIDSSTGVIINNPSPTTNADGYVQTTATIPAAGATCTNGACNITLTAGGASATFTLTVPGSGGTTGGGTGTGGGTTAPSQVNIVSGNGQLVQTGNAAAYPMVLQVTDPTGKPLPNVQVTFTITSGASGSVGSGGSYTTTDVNGMASSYFYGEAISQSLAYENNTVTAQSQYGSVPFTETVFAITEQQGVITGGPETDLLAPLPGINPVVAQGTPTVGAIQARAQTQSQPCIGCPIPGVGLILINNQNPNQPLPVSCKGTPVSDATGLVSCDLVASCTAIPNTYPLTISVGGLNSFDRAVTVTAGGTASQITLTSGNNQSGGVGNQLAVPLVATVANGCGNGVQGAQVSWSITQGSATLNNTVSSSDSSGRVSTNLTFGATPGPVSVKVTLPTIGSVTFSLTNNVVIAGLTIVSGNNQSAAYNQAFQPLVVQVLDVNRNPVNGLPITFNVVTGVAGLNPSTASTNSSGLASTTPTAGSVAGAVSITATGGGFTATFSLTVTAPGPSITAGSFVNAASFATGLAPCGLGTVSGTGVAAGVPAGSVLSGVSPFSPYPYTLGGFSMSIDGVPAPIESISNQNGVQQANFQTPCETPAGSATVVLTISGVNTTIQGVQVVQAQPGIFTYQGPTGKPYGAVIRAADGSYVTPSSYAHRGETYYVVVTGLGQTSPAASTNSVGIAGLNVIPQVIVGVNNAGVQVVSAQYSVGSIGVYLVGFQIPLTAPTGPDQPLAVAVIVGNSVAYANPAYLAGVQ